MAKVKNWKSDEAIVVGYTQGENSRSSTFGALILAQRDKQGKLHYIGRAAGLKNKDLAAMLKKMQALKTTKTPLAEVPEDVKALSWVKPELVIEVKYLIAHQTESCACQTSSEKDPTNPYHK